MKFICFAMIGIFLFSCGDKGKPSLKRKISGYELSTGKHARKGFLRGKNDRKVRVNTIEKEESKNTEIGIASEVLNPRDDVQCNIVMEAPKNKQGTIDQAFINSRSRVDVVEVPNGSTGNGNFLWMIILNGKDCQEVSGEDGYIGSTLKELLADSSARKGVNSDGSCERVGSKGEKKKYPCTIPIDHAESFGSNPFFGIQWGGRDDLNFGVGNDSEE